MPNIITHKIFAEEVIKKLVGQQERLHDLITSNLQLFYIGSNGPDYLFFHNAKPWLVTKSHEMSHIGSELHKQHVNGFYESAIRSIRSQKNEMVKKNMMVYLMGHLCHWALDKTAHPYIFYKTGNCKGKSAYDHHRFESMMDTMMLRKYRNTSISAYPFYEICEHDDEMLKAIARIYVPAIKDTMGKDIKVYDIRKALDDWEDIQKMFFDPADVKKPLLEAIEKPLHQKGLISGYIVMENIDDTYDVLNEKHTRWYHPCDLRISSQASFIDLFDEALDTAVMILKEALIECDKEDEITIGNYLKNEAYDSGMANAPLMCHFDNIYKEED